MCRIGRERMYYKLFEDNHIICISLNVLRTTLTTRRCYATMRRSIKDLPYSWNIYSNADRVTPITIGKCVVLLMNASVVYAEALL